MAAIDTFISTYKPHAESVSRVTGIPAEIILAQAGFESGWKTNPPGNNFFGVKKGTSWTGPTVLIRTKEVLSNSTSGSKFPKVYSVTKRPDGKFTYDVQDHFRAYPTPADSFADWAALVRTRYPVAWSVRHDKTQFAAALKGQGYATDPDYATKLVNVLRSVERRLGLPLTAAAGSVGFLAAVATVAALLASRKGKG